MCSDFERLEICNTPSFVYDLYQKTSVFTSNMKYELTPALEELLLKHDILLQVKYLLTDGVNAKTYFYALCTKDTVKCSNTNSSVFYVWNKKTALWEEHKRSAMEKIYLKEFIENIYMTIYLLIKEMKDESFAISNNKNPKLISTTTDLLSRLLKMKDSAMTQSKIREILHKYIKYVVDPEFIQLINPPGYISVAGKQVVNLKTGEVKERTKTDYFTVEIPVKYDPTAHSKLWDTIINQIMLFDKEKINFLQEILGYCLSGDCQEGKLLMLIGESRAGKSIIINLLELILGNFSTFLNKSLIINTGKASDSPEPFMAELKNKRVGIMNELQQTDVINTTKFKILATNEKYTYRVLNSNDIEKTDSRHVILLASNHKPIFPETDQSIWERLVIINFNARFIDEPKNANEFKVDRKLNIKLRDEKEAILKWLIDGCIRYFEHGKLNIPESSLEALEEYKTMSQDEHELYFSNRLEMTKDDKDRIQVSALYTDYKEWCLQNNVKKITNVAFGEIAFRKNIPKVKNSNHYYTNVKIKEVPFI